MTQVAQIQQVTIAELQAGDVVLFNDQEVRVLRASWQEFEGGLFYVVLENGTFSDVASAQVTIATH